MVVPGKIDIQEFPLPEISDDTALMEMKMSGICGTEKHMYKGEIIRFGRKPHPLRVGMNGGGETPPNPCFLGSPPLVGGEDVTKNRGADLVVECTGFVKPSPKDSIY